MRTWSLRAGVDPTPAELGGRLCLAFVNSVQWRRGPAPEDQLPDHSALVGYLHRVGLLDDGERTALLSLDAGPAGRVHAEALVLREVLFRLLSSVAAGARPADEDLAALTVTLRAGLGRLRLDADTTDRITSGWPDSTAPQWPLWEVAASAAALLLEGERAYLKLCPGERCGWLFTDRSRNHSRRWCDSAMCGNRERARRFYHQHAHRERD